MILALIGAGVMGQALTRSFSRRGSLPADQIRVYDTDTGKAAAFAGEIGASACPASQDAARDADIVLLAVKPAVIPLALSAIAGQISEKMILVSIAAGITLAAIRSLAGPRPAIARAMPNTPAQIGDGVTALCFDAADARQSKTVLDLFASCGLVFEVKEDLMDAVTGLSGSGPAFVMLMIEAMADAGVRLGLQKDVALKMAAMTVMGSARLVLSSDRHPAELRSQICTPGGTTVEGLYVLEGQGVRAAMIQAVCAAADKSRAMREKSGSHA